MENNNSVPSVALISGAYSSALWDALVDMLELDESEYSIFLALNSLHQNGQDEVAFGLVEALYDMAGISMPDDAKSVNTSFDTRSSYITMLLQDIEDML